MSVAQDALETRLAAIERLERDGAVATARLAEQLKQLSAELGAVSEKLESIDGEGKFNVRKWIRDNLPAIIAGAAAVAALAK